MNSDFIDTDTFTLAEIIRELITEEKVYATEAAIRERFKKLMNYLAVTTDTLKNSDKEISFSNQERELVKALLIELGEPYLQRLTSKKPIGKTVDKGLEEAKAFRDRMDKYMKAASIKDENMRRYWTDIIEILSRYQLKLAQVKLLNHIKEAGEKIIQSDLSYNELIEIIKEADSAVNNWINKRFK
jgi:hypothetical protein